jgi:CRISPR-associated endonuclease Csn1
VQILLKHLENYNEINGSKVTEHPELAFSTDGIDDLNKNIIALNKGKFHHPIQKVRTYEAKGNKFNVGIKGNKKDKFVEAAKGTNLFFAIYKDDKGKRNYETIPLNIVIENQKQGALQNIKPEFCSVPTKNEKADDLLFHLSPNDLVYVPTNEELENPNLVDFNKLSKDQINRIYKTVSFTGTQAFFIKNEVANTIVNKVEYSALNKMERGINGEMIKDICWKIKTDRLGNVIKVLR